MGLNGNSSHVVHIQNVTVELKVSDNLHVLTFNSWAMRFIKGSMYVLVSLFLLKSFQNSCHGLQKQKVSVIEDVEEIEKKYLKQ